MHYYNENDPHAAQWLRNLIADKRLPHGDVDDRSIVDVQAADLTGYTQCHFFAGIGGWPLALRLAGWPRDRAVWTGSCPCQPFSTAGKRRGADDERHLWPQFHRLIADGKPPVVFGEQVASKDGRVWLAGVRADLEALGYAVGAADLCAAGVGAPHIRQRLFWVAESKGAGVGRHDRNMASKAGPARTPRDRRQDGHVAASGRTNGGLGEAQLLRARAGTDQGAPTEIGRDRLAIAGAAVQRVGDTNGWSGDERNGAQQSRHGAADHWANSRTVTCGDGFARRVESGTFPLAHGLPRSLGPSSTRQQRMDLRTAKRNRRVRLSGYGNAIVPQVAAEFITAFTEAIAD